MTTRTRKTPQARVEEILDAAVSLVLKDGVTRATMDRVAKEVGVSKGLMYAYFDNRLDLMQQVLKREQLTLAEKQRAAIQAADSFETMARDTHQINEVHEQRRGLLIQRLKADPAIGESVTKIEAEGRADILDYLGRTIARNFDLPAGIAQTATSLILSFDLAPRQDGPGSDEIWAAMMQGAMLELKKRYGVDHS